MADHAHRAGAEQQHDRARRVHGLLRAVPSGGGQGGRRAEWAAGGAQLLPKVRAARQERRLHEWALPHRVQRVDEAVGVLLCQEVLSLFV
eukprot:993015-Alexandrium_andersonii.AAC.1